MNAAPLEAAAWTLLIIAIMFAAGFGVLAGVEWLRAKPADRRGLAMTPKERALLLGMAGAALPAFAAEVLLRTFSPYLLLAIVAPVAVAAFVLGRRIARQAAPRGPSGE